MTAADKKTTAAIPSTAAANVNSINLLSVDIQYLHYRIIQFASLQHFV